MGERESMMKEEKLKGNRKGVTLKKEVHLHIFPLTKLVCWLDRQSPICLGYTFTFLLLFRNAFPKHS